MIKVFSFFHIAYFHNTRRSKTVIAYWPIALSWGLDVFPIPPTPSQLQAPSTIAVWLSACLPDSLDLDRCLSILFWLSACDFAFVGALEIWSLRLRLDPYSCTNNIVGLALKMCSYRKWIREQNSHVVSHPVFIAQFFLIRNRICKLEISNAPTREASYSQALNQNKINKHGSRSGELGRRAGGHPSWWMVFRVEMGWEVGEEDESAYLLKSSVFRFEWKTCGKIARGEVWWVCRMSRI